jgi:hypothetical protein
MGRYLIDADYHHEPLEEFVPEMMQDLHEHPDEFLFVKVDRTLVGYVNSFGSRFGCYYIRHIFCAKSKEGLNFGKLLLALAEGTSLKTRVRTVSGGRTIRLC